MLLPIAWVEPDVPTGRWLGEHHTSALVLVLRPAVVLTALTPLRLVVGDPYVYARPLLALIFTAAPGHNNSVRWTWASEVDDHPLVVVVVSS